MVFADVPSSIIDGEAGNNPRSLMLDGVRWQCVIGQSDGWRTHSHLLVPSIHDEYQRSFHAGVRLTVVKCSGRSVSGCGVVAAEGRSTAAPMNKSFQGLKGFTNDDR